MSFAGSDTQSPDARVTSERASLRDILRAATAAEHQALDQGMAHLVLSRRVDFVRFLGIHLCARRGIEEWLGANSPPGWEPPAQTDLIAADLAVLGIDLASVTPAVFDPGCEVDWTGPAYVIAGSHLGNRLLLAQCGAGLPDKARQFLTGEAMQHYWRRLRTLLSEASGPDGGAAAILGAHATFAHFGACVEKYAKADLAAA